MTQDPRAGTPQGGIPPQGYPQPGGYPPQPQGGYPPPQQGGYPPQPQGGYPQQGGYPPQGGYGPQGGYPPLGGYGPQGAYPPPGGYGPQGAYGPRPGSGGFGPQGPDGGYGGPGPKKKSPLMLILIVVAAVVLLAGIGGVIMALSNDDGDQPSTSITPGQPSLPPSDPSASPAPSGSPSGSNPSDEPSSNPGNPPSGGGAVDVGNGISVTPADGWTVKKKTTNAVQLSDGTSIYLGQSTKVTGGTNPGQLCTAWHKQIAGGASGGKYENPKNVDLGTSKLKGSTCLGQVTVSSGQGSGTVYLFTIVSVRASDGVAVLGTVYFSKSQDTDALDKAFSAMSNSMLESQAAG